MAMKSKKINIWSGIGLLIVFGSHAILLLMQSGMTLGEVQVHAIVNIVAGGMIYWGYLNK